MQRADTFEVVLDDRRIAVVRKASVSIDALARGILVAWHKFLRPPVDNIELAQERDATVASPADGGAAIFENYFAGAYDRVCAAEPVASFRDLTRRGAAQ